MSTRSVLSLGLWFALAVGHEVLRAQDAPPAVKKLGRVIIDSSRDGGSWWFPQANEFTDDQPHQGKHFSDLLKHLGYEVVELPRNNAKLDFSGAAIVVRFSFFGEYSPADVAEYRAFVERGGRLILVRGFVREERGPQDKVAAAFGFNFSKLIKQGQISKFEPHDITRGITSLPYTTGSIIEARPDGSKALAFTDAGEVVMAEAAVGGGHVIALSTPFALLQASGPFAKQLLKIGFTPLWLDRPAQSGQPPRAAGGQEAPRPTSWGELRTFGRSTYNRMYSAVIKNRPADGRLVFPADIEPVFQAALPVALGPAAGRGVLPLEFDPHTGALTIPLPDDAGWGPRSGAVLLATDRTSQTGNRIIFPAQSARIVGDTAKLESTGSHHRIGSWTDATDRVVWDYTATRWGRYEVFLIYSTASPSGGVATIAMGGESLDVELPSTGGWYRYETISAGKLLLKADGKHELSVAAKKLTGPALMNVKAVSLVPTQESDARIVQAADGSVTLHARDARVSGVKLRYEPKPEKDTLGYWTNAGDSAMWWFEIREPGKFDIEVLQGCGVGQGGSTMQVWGTGINIFEFRVEETGHFQTFVPRIVGRMTTDRVGPATLVIAVKRIARSAACDIRHIRLIRAQPEPAHPGPQAP